MSGFYLNKIKYLTSKHLINMTAKKRVVIVYFIIFLYSLIFNELFSQRYTIEENLSAQLEVFPQEKIHVHTDRDFYVSGEKIWFKAYVADAASHLPITYSQYIYVELINSDNSPVNRVMIRQTDGMFYGHIPLSETPEGNYTLRAYTRYMENLGDDYFFKKNIRIGALSSAKNRLPQPNVSGSRRERAVRDDFDVSFFPEGGNLIDGIFCMVAFKATNRNGSSEIISGNLIDEDGVAFSTVASYHAGMGVFGYIPQLGKRIFLKCKNADGLEKQFELPQPVMRASSLTAVVRGNRFLIGVTKVESFIEKAEIRAIYDDDMRLYHIEEIMITAPKHAPSHQFWGNSVAEGSIDRELIERYRVSYVSDYLNLTAGVRVFPNGAISIRGIDGLPLVLIDGVEQHWPYELRDKMQSPLELIPPNLVESIHVFKGPSIIVFGGKGINGAISITTKRDMSVSPMERPNTVVYTPLGYQMPVEFFSPKYETQEQKQSVIPDYRSTIFWKPDLIISDGNEASFEFYTSDLITTYSVVIEGMTNDGRIVRQMGKIRVE